MKSRKTLFTIFVAVLLLVFGIVPASASISPGSLTAELTPGESITETKTVTIPDIPPIADIVFAFDLTGSMGGIINTAKARALDIMTTLNAIPGVDIHFGVMSYMDYNGYYSSCSYANYYGSGSDYPYRLDQAVTDNTGTVAAKINALILGNGADGPQDYTRILYESYADPEVNWRSGAKRILINFGDNVPHDCNLNEGLASVAWSTGCDPGRDAIAGTGDDLDLQAVLAEMAANGVVLLEAHSTLWLIDYWDHWTEITSGNVFLTGSTTLVNDVIAEVNNALIIPSVTDLHLQASTGFESWLVSVDPASYGSVSPGDAVLFDLTITVPAGTADGVYNFIISAVDAVGVSYGDQDVSITVVNNQPPVADPNGPYLGPVSPDVIAFDGTGSTDPDGDALTFDWVWGDGTTSLDAGAIPVHSYADAGVYDVCLTVSDGLATDTACSYVIVFDPNGGFVTGAGWIYSPAGAYTPDESIEGFATFGFVSKYLKGRVVPEGETEFHFNTASGFKFHSTSYEWLVIAPDYRARYQGYGTVWVGDEMLGEPGAYRFVLTAIDGALDGTGQDKFRIRIWEDGGGVIYDNEISIEDGLDPTTVLESGNIIVHSTNWAQK